MSTHYRNPEDVPNDVLAARLKELSDYCTKNDMPSEFTMRIPAELDRDADLVMAEAARRLLSLPLTRSLDGGRGEAWQRSLTCSVCGGIRLGMKGTGPYHVCVNKKCISYAQFQDPERTKEEIAGLYSELILAVGMKHPNETRHQTALKYIQNAEKGSNIASAPLSQEATATGQGEA